MFLASTEPISLQGANAQLQRSFDELHANMNSMSQGVASQAAAQVDVVKQQLQAEVAALARRLEMAEEAR